MPIVNASLLPHSPLLIPEIGQANHNFLAKTVSAYEKVAEEIKNSGAEIVIMISAHGPAQPDAFTVNVAPEMEVDLKEFGFIPPKTVFIGDAPLADQIKNALRPDLPLQLISENILDHGSAIPLYCLKSAVGDKKILVISPASALSLNDQLAFGNKLGEVINSSDKKIAVIASGDMSHRLKKKSPAGYSPKGAKFDNKLIEYLSEPKSASENILKMDNKLITDASECGLKALVVVLGVLSNSDWKPEVLAYQTDFGIGYLSFSFKI